MDVSKVSFTEQTRQQLQNPMIDRKKRQELRRQLAVAYIKSKPTGSAFSSREFAKACFPKGYATSNVLRFVKQMQRDGLVNVEPIPNSYKYIVTVNDAKTLVAPKAPKVQPLWKDHEETPVAPVPVQQNHSLTEYAKQFAWERNSDSLREFVEYMDGRELEFRRMANP